MVRVDCSLKGVTKEDILDYHVNPPVDTRPDFKAWEIIEKTGTTEALVYIHFKVDLISDRDALYRIKA